MKLRASPAGKHELRLSSSCSHGRGEGGGDYKFVAGGRLFPSPLRSVARVDKQERDAA
jgi:hypothetical protein